MFSLSVARLGAAGAICPQSDRCVKARAPSTAAFLKDVSAASP
jgi:hypothetical protein